MEVKDPKTYIGPGATVEDCYIQGILDSVACLQDFAAKADE